MDAHLGILSDLNDGVGHGLGLSGVAGRLDLTKLAYVGHSAGGGYVGRLLNEERSDNARALVLIEPADLVVEPRRAVPTLLIRGGCDEDSAADAGLSAMPSIVKAGNAPVLDLLVPDAGHRMLNTALRSASSCPGKIDPTLAQGQVATAISAFVSASMSEARVDLPILDGTNSKVRSMRKGDTVTTHDLSAAPHFIPLTDRLKECAI